MSLAVTTLALNSTFLPVFSSAQCDPVRCQVPIPFSASPKTQILDLAGVTATLSSDGARSTIRHGDAEAGDAPADGVTLSPLAPSTPAAASKASPLNLTRQK
jgi:hypothetical protein